MHTYCFNSKLYVNKTYVSTLYIFFKYIYYTCIGVLFYYNQVHKFLFIFFITIGNEKIIFLIHAMPMVFIYVLSINFIINVMEKIILKNVKKSLTLKNVL